MTGEIIEWRCMWEAKVKMPCDMDLDELKSIITVAKEVLSDLPAGVEPKQEHAAQIKEYCDEHFGRNWQVIVGRNFGVHCVHDAKHFSFFYIGEAAVLVTRTQ
mmetsp:Transcript_8738/g.15340  ORF Transcript_8738/g.15340 Transcript_8738/m.15340 type:complete len:103 (+) Transcript_8738:165-473(+)